MDIKTSEIIWRHEFNHIQNIVNSGQNIIALVQDLHPPQDYKVNGGGDSNKERTLKDINKSFSIVAFDIKSGSYLYSSDLFDNSGIFLEFIHRGLFTYVLYSKSLSCFDARNGALVFTYVHPSTTIKGDSAAEFKTIFIDSQAIIAISDIGSTLHSFVFDFKGTLLDKLIYDSTPSISAGSKMQILSDRFLIFDSEKGPLITEIGPVKKTVNSFESFNIGSNYKLLRPRTREYSADMFLLIDPDNKVYVASYSPESGVSIIHTVGDLKDSFFSFSRINDLLSAVTVVRKQNMTHLSTKVYMNGDFAQYVQLENYSFDFESTGDIELVSVDFFNKGKVGPVPRLIIGTRDQSFHCVKNSAKSWTMEESLTRSVSSLIINKLGLSKKLLGLEQEEVILGNLLEKFQTRFARHYLKFIDYFFGSEITEPQEGKYGFNKLALFASERGKIVALDSENGGVLWKKYFPNFQPLGLVLMRDAHIVSPPIVALVGTFESTNESFVFQINAVTGEVMTQKEIKGAKLTHVAITEYQDPKSKIHSLFLRDTLGGCSFFPSVSKEILLNRPFYYYLAEVGADHIKGSLITGGKSFSPTWRLDFPEDETLFKIVAPLETNAASLGRVLGSRNVLYKYLNPNMIAMLTISSVSKKKIVFYLVDSISGRVHVRAPHTKIGLEWNYRKYINLVMCENFVIYTFWNMQSNHTNSPHYQVVVMELYQSIIPDIRVSGNNFSSFTSNELEYLQKSFVISHPVTALGVTSTAAGITSREILFAYSHGLIQGVSRRLLDPHRPLSALSTQEREEGLLPYFPFLAINPLEALTYNKQVLGVRSIKTISTNLESTSIVLASGLDIFSTRRTPSKPFDTLSLDFSYSQLIASIIFLSFGVYFTNTQVKAKRIKELWL